MPKGYTPPQLPIKTTTYDTHDNLCATQVGPNEVQKRNSAAAGVARKCDWRHKWHATTEGRVNHRKHKHGQGRRDNRIFLTMHETRPRPTIRQSNGQPTKKKLTRAHNKAVNHDMCRAANKRKIHQRSVWSLYYLVKPGTCRLPPRYSFMAKFIRRVQRLKIQDNNYNE